MEELAVLKDIADSLKWVITWLFAIWIAILIK